MKPEMLSKFSDQFAHKNVEARSTHNGKVHRQIREIRSKELFPGQPSEIFHVLQTFRLQNPILQNYGAIILTHRDKCSLRPSSWNLLLQ